MTQRTEYVGRYRKTGNTMALFIPLELRHYMQEHHGWKNGDYIVAVVHEGLIMIRRFDKTMIIDRAKDERSRQA